jgi:hypothetical protein
MKTYKIFPFRCRINQDGLTNVIESITWEVTEPMDVDGTTYDLTARGVTELPNPDPNNFIQTDDLTKEQVVTWIETYSDVDGKLSHMVNVKRSQLNPIHTNITPNFE